MNEVTENVWPGLKHEDRRRAAGADFPFCDSSCEQYYAPRWAQRCSHAHAFTPLRSFYILFLFYLLHFLHGHTYEGGGCKLDAAAGDTEAVGQVIASTLLHLSNMPREGLCDTLLTVGNI